MLIGLYALGVYSLIMTVLFIASKAESMRSYNDAAMQVANINKSKDISDIAAFKLAIDLGVALRRNKELDDKIRKSHEDLLKEYETVIKKIAEVAEYKTQTTEMQIDLDDAETLIKIKDIELNEKDEEIKKLRNSLSDIKHTVVQLEKDLGTSQQLINLRDKDIDLISERVNELKSASTIKQEELDKLAEEYKCFRTYITEAALSEVLKKLREQLGTPLPSESYTIYKACDLKPAS